MRLKSGYDSPSPVNSGILFESNLTLGFACVEVEAVGCGLLGAAGASTGEMWIVATLLLSWLTALVRAAIYLKVVHRQHEKVNLKRYDFVVEDRDSTNYNIRAFSVDSISREA